MNGGCWFEFTSPTTQHKNSLHWHDNASDSNSLPGLHARCASYLVVVVFSLISRFKIGECPFPVTPWVIRTGCASRGLIWRSNFSGLTGSLLRSLRACMPTIPYPSHALTHQPAFGYECPNKLLSVVDIPSTVLLIIIVGSARSMHKVLFHRSKPGCFSKSFISTNRRLSSLSGTLGHK